MGELKRGFSFISILALAVSSILGTGLFFGVSIGAQLAGNSSILAWAILGVFAIYTSMCFAELSSMFPNAGGVYEFSKQAYGRFVSFMVGWSAWLVGNITTTLLVVAAIEYLTPTGFPLLFKISLSLMFILLLNAVAYTGQEASSATMLFFLCITVAVVLAIAVPGMFQIKTGNFVPLLTHPLTAVLTAMFFLSETYFGWESATYLSEETENPETTIPKALIWGTLIVAIATALVVVVLMGTLPWELLGTMQTPLVSVSEIFFGSMGASFIGMGIYLVMIGSAAGGIISSPRLIMAMARDRLFFAKLKEIHPKYHTPHNAVIFQGFLSVLIVFFGFGQYRILLAILVPVASVMYMLILLAVPLLRVRKPELNRPYKVVGGTWMPIFAALFFVIIVGAWLITEMQINLFLMVMFMLLAGLPLYALFEMYYNPKSVVKVNDRLAKISVFAERITLPRKVRREILHLLGNVKGKRILEFGCGVGTITLVLAKAVGSTGEVIATNVSRTELGILERRVRKLKTGKITVMHDMNQHKRVNPDIPRVDVIVSVGYMGYVKDVKRVLKGMNGKLHKGSKILFMDYDRFFGIVPNIDWITDDAIIKKNFNKAGFNVGVIRKKGWFWQYVYIHGVKYSEVE